MAVRRRLESHFFGTRLGGQAVISRLQIGNVFLFHRVFGGQDFALGRGGKHRFQALFKYSGDLDFMPVKFVVIERTLGTDSSRLLGVVVASERRVAGKRFLRDGTVQASINGGLGNERRDRLSIISGLRGRRLGLLQKPGFLYPSLAWRQRES